MAYTLLQSGSSLQMMDTSGTLTTLTLPTGVSINSTLTPRFAVFGQYAVMVNSCSRPLLVDGQGIVRVLSPRPPGTIPILTGQAGGALTGTFTVKQTFRITDTFGNIIAESDYGPPSAATAIAAQYLKAASLDLSTDAVTSTQLYRTTTNGTVFFPWIAVDGNTQTSVQDDLADAGLGLIAAPTLGAAPDLTLVVEWRGRLWGVDRKAIDYARYTETGVMYAWPASNSLPVPRLGADARGVTAFIPRRDALGIGRRNAIHQVTGTSNTDFRVVKLSENVGVESQESVVIYRDTAYWLWKDGVYQWDTNGISCISDGKVKNWFASDTYFNRNVYSASFAMIDPIRNKYQLFLAAVGGTTINRWVEYDITDKTWWGPHKTDAFTPTAAVVVTDANDTLVPMIGDSTGFLSQNQATRTDWTSTGIAFNVNSKFHDAGTPSVEKYWGELYAVGKVQPAGSLTITSKVGYLDATATVIQSYDMTTGRQRLGRLGQGKLAQLNFAHTTAGQNVELYGFEVDPVTEIGRR